MSFNASHPSPPPDVIGLVDDIGAAHDLSTAARSAVLKSILGWHVGNRDRDVFRLAALMALDLNREVPVVAWIFDFLSSESKTGWRRQDRALLDAILTVVMVSELGDNDLPALLEDLEAARATPDPRRALVSVLAKTLHAYRRRILSDTRHHNIFTAVRSFLRASSESCTIRRAHDGDALALWEHVGTRGFLTRYDSSLNAIIDYTEAVAIAATWGMPVHHVDLMTVDVALRDHDESRSREDDAHDVLGALDKIAAFPIKLLKASELATLRNLAQHGKWSSLWPRSALGSLAFSGAQARITQDLRKPSGSELTQFLPLKSPGSFEAVRATVAQLHEQVLDVVFLVSDLMPDGVFRQTALARSKSDPERSGRIKAMQRRKSFREVLSATSSDDLAHQAHEALAPLSTILNFLSAITASWARMQEQTLSAWAVEDAERHRAKLKSLYGEAYSGVTKDAEG